ncbi:Phosphate uptake regulator, PhoU [Acidilobus saccharovorans 345-15]|uniref:Phosphate uptake regulator, PhoU n=1 Tax=Acidilobus saccharovorans (strain DSM 16705 / JCM 18335 / VKM B-2471 / 345-15) TaxID=666510 RepID=D9Q0N3_ACIS3|nr:phosphate uptake regulator PhoU [Acidilobus saccharovorans]ADL18871.1 Phosphate uptake regulator, PhoU [Acidilobus saccharovorans 345-15]
MQGQDEEGEASSFIVKRKVQITGGSTYIVSLPKEWAKVLNIDKGSEVLLELNPEGWIRLRSPNSASRSVERATEVVLRPNLSDAVLSMQIISAYLAGYDTINIKFDTQMAEAAERIANFVRTKTIGLELLEESNDQLTLKTVVDLTSISAHTAVENMIRVVKSMITDLSDVIEGLKQRDLLDAIIRRDDIVDKLYLYIFKQLNLALQGLMSPKELGMNALAEAINLYTMVKSLERIADQVVSIAQWLLDYNGQLTPEIRQLFDKVKLSVLSSIDLINTLSQEQILLMYESLHREAVWVAELYSKARASGCANECYPIFDGARRIVAQTIDLLEAMMGLNALRSLENRRAFAS